MLALILGACVLASQKFGVSPKTELPSFFAALQDRLKLILIGSMAFLFVVRAVIDAATPLLSMWKQLQFCFLVVAIVHEWFDYVRFLLPIPISMTITVR